MTPSSNMHDASPSALGRGCVLVVEDEFLIRLLICDELRDQGYRVIEACDGDEALVVLERRLPIDLVLSDVRMPGSSDGVGVLEFVKATRPDVPVILMSGHLERGVAMANGAAQFLSKPFAIGVVTDAVRMELEKTA